MDNGVGSRGRKTSPVNTRNDHSSRLSWSVLLPPPSFIAPLITPRLLCSLKQAGHSHPVVLLHVLSQLSQSILPRAPDGAPTTHGASYFQLLDLSLPLLVGEDDDRTLLAHRTRFPLRADTIDTQETEVMAATARQMRLPLHGTEADWAREAFWHFLDEVLLVEEKILSRIITTLRHLLDFRGWIHTHSETGEGVALPAERTCVTIM